MNPIQTTNTSRRNFLKRASATTIAGAASPWLLNLAAIGEAAATTGEDYKALVCVFLNGGMDYANTVVTYDSTSHATYTAIRGSAVAIPRTTTGTVAGLENTVLEPVTPLPNARQYALAPALKPLHTLFNSGNLAVLLNVGTLVKPIVKSQYSAVSNDVPANLMSHEDQAALWQSSYPETSGWGARMGAQIEGNYGSMHSAFTCMSIAGNAKLLNGPGMSPYTINSAGAVTITGTYSLYGSADCIAALRTLTTQSRTHVMEAEYNRVVAASINTGNLFSRYLKPISALPVAFPADNTLAEQLKLVARTIASAGELGVRRQIFFVSLGGFDHHDGLKTQLPALQAKVADALAAFYANTQALGVADKVTAFTASDFGRSLTANGNATDNNSWGSDHGWGSMHFVLGGAVNGKQIYGKAPAVGVNTVDDIGQGRLIPSTSIDQYFATLGKWFGISDANLSTALPNLGNYAPAARDLGFMKVASSQSGGTATSGISTEFGLALYNPMYAAAANAFTDVTTGGPLTALRVQGGSWIDGIQGFNASGPLPSHGNTVGGSSSTFTLAAGEYFVRVFGFYGRCVLGMNTVAQLSFVTNTGRVFGPIGSRSDQSVCVSFDYSLPPNTKLYGFKGTTNSYLASLAFIYGP